MRHLTLPRKILVKNWRLLFLYRCMFCLLASLLVAHFIHQQRWSRAIPMSNGMRAAIWAPPVANTTYLQDEYERVRSEPDNLCEHPHLYDYQWSPDNEWTYLGHSCIGVCNPARVGLDCLSGAQIIQPSTNELFFATEAEISYASPGNASRSFLSPRYFIPLEKVYRFEMMYAFNIPQETTRSAGNLWTAQAFSGGWGSNAYTVVVDINDRPRKYIAPSTTLGMSVAELLNFAGKPHILDEEQPSLGANQLSNARHSKGPVGRLTGVEINIQLHCYSPGYVPSKYDVDDWNGIVCIARVKPAPPNWIARQQVDFVSGQVRFHWFHGILVRVTFTGSVHHFDFIVMLEFLTTAIILLGLPARAMRFLVSHCLGHMSEVYFGVLNQEFDLPQHVACSAINLMSNSVAYSLIAGKNDGISIADMSSRIESSLAEFPELNDQELKAFTLFCYAVACDVRGNSFSSYSFRGRLKKKARRLLLSSVSSLFSVNTGESSGNVEWKDMSMASFLVTASIQQGVGLDHVVKLFDRDRRLGMLERVFADRFIRSHVFKSKPVKLGSGIFASVEDLDAKISEANEENAGAAQEITDSHEMHQTSEAMTANQEHREEEGRRTNDDGCYEHHWQAKYEECLARVLQLESFVAKQNTLQRELSRLTELEEHVAQNTSLLTELRVSLWQKDWPNHSDPVDLAKEDVVSVSRQHGPECSRQFCKGCAELQQSHHNIDTKVKEAMTAATQLFSDMSYLTDCTHAISQRLQQLEQSCTALRAPVERRNACALIPQSSGNLGQMVKRVPVRPELLGACREHAPKPWQEPIPHIICGSTASQDIGPMLSETAEYENLGPSSAYQVQDEHLGKANS